MPYSPLRRIALLSTKFGQCIWRWAFISDCNMTMRARWSMEIVIVALIFVGIIILILFIQGTSTMKL